MRNLLSIVSALALLALPAGAQQMGDEPQQQKAQQQQMQKQQQGQQADVSAPPPLEPVTQNGVKFLSGGVGDQEQQRIEQLQEQYNVRVSLATPEGAYLARSDLKLETADGEKLVETTTRGPIVLAQLDPGRYVLHASSEGRTSERRVIDVPKQDGPEQQVIHLTLAEQGASDAQAKQPGPKSPQGQRAEPQGPQGQQGQQGAQTGRQGDAASQARAQGAGS